MKRLIWLVLGTAVAGCTTVPPTNVHQPMSVRPPMRQESPSANGAIYQASAARPLFEDRRARYVGDTITITISESTSASLSANNKLDRTGSQKASIGASTGMFGKVLPNEASLSNSSTNAFSGKGEAANRNTFTGSMTATVIDVYPNGNLLVSGEKLVSLGAEQELVRISGVVNPAFVDAANSVASTKIADARIEYKSSGQIAEGMSMAWLARFFLNVLPF